MPLYPLTFQPIFKERVWGGRRLADLYQKNLPPAVPIGESWEITDRPEGVSVISNGPFAGQDLRWLMEHHQAELLGPVQPQGGRFPLLVKLLDAQDDLSLQVHPPAHKAVELGGEPKTEMWYITHATPTAQIYVGLKKGVTREEFERKVKDGSVAECFHRHTVKAGDSMFLPSGRVHALGAGSVLFEIQQNSDTTYRVFDWNRVGLDGKPRDLHLAQALASIDFNDFEPALLSSTTAASGAQSRRSLVNHELFSVDLLTLPPKSSLPLKHSGPLVIAATRNSVSLLSSGDPVHLQAGQFAVLPASVTDATLQTGSMTDASILVAEAK
ncbi:MAG: mannose-6-phosphate isomerase type [Verrucomicrobia bacterium]|jgi:mannose-6-phosphate isomerase|nr:mannose-6-phosphate isomerase type [Verrucomicrobiota bacterium]